MQIHRFCILHMQVYMDYMELIMEYNFNTCMQYNMNIPKLLPLDRRAFSAYNFHNYFSF